MPRKHSRGQRAAHDRTDPDLFFGESKRKQNRRKDHQLCGQVQRALSEALGADFGDDVLNQLWVVRVEPAPTASRLLVWVAGPPDVAPDVIIERLGRISGLLRTEVAAAIARKRVPHLLYAIHTGEPEA
ncbi:MAG: ribosome-binding factor A [Myxococcales bacterium]|nr:ribosome-binding factor A [Myxococcales bacterium]